MGAKSAYNGIKIKRAKKEEERRRRDGDNVHSYDPTAESPKKKHLKRKLSIRQKPEPEGFNKSLNDSSIAHSNYDYRSSPQPQGDTSLGISDEGRACAEARAERDHRRAQRMTDYGLAVAMARARRNAMGGIPGMPQHTVVDPPPAYNPADPRLPSYIEPTIASSEDLPCFSPGTHQNF